MISRLLAALVLSLPLLAAGKAEIRLPAPQAAELAAHTGTESFGRLRVGAVRAVPKAARADSWTPVAGGFVTRFSATSETAMGLRTRLDLGALTSPVEVRVQGNGRIETMTLAPGALHEAWTPWTEGATQEIELFSATLPSNDAVALGAVLHFTDSPFAKAAAVCTVPTSCTTNSPVLDAAVLEARRAVAKMTFVDGGSAFLCTGTLVETQRIGEPFFLTANHCIDTSASASSLSTFWFYETDCTGTLVDPGMVQRAGGAQLVFTNYNQDATLLKLNEAPPAGAVYARMNAAPLGLNAPIVSISHPKGDAGRLALGAISGQSQFSGHANIFQLARFTRGIIEGGSSGSALMTLSGGRLEVRGTLFGSTIVQPGGMSCTNNAEQAIYSRLEDFLPQIAPYINNPPPTADDAPNRPQDLFTQPFADPNGVDRPLDLRTTPLEFNSRRVDYGGDMDVYRFRVTAPTVVSVWSEGSLDMVGSILDAQGATVATNDDANFAANNLNFSITRQLAAGTYYLQVANFASNATGTYSVRLRAESVGINYTDLWWSGPGESGWGVNVNHQDNTLFATLFTYDAAGAPLWLSMSGGVRQADGSYLGALYRTTGPAFNANPFTPIGQANLNQVGTMRFAFVGRDTGTLTYSVNGAQVVKQISRLAFGTPPTCAWDRGDRASTFNFQDLWWNPQESGWGVNLTHQSDTLFATLFTYDAQGQPLWLVMSNGTRINATGYEGELFRTTGPAFNANPFTPIGPSNYTSVGRMSFSFSHGNSGVMNYTYNGVNVTKVIERLVFGNLRTACNDED